jgi:hypothetical protein
MTVLNPPQTSGGYVPGEAAAGVLAASFSRKSTNKEPILRDFVSILDYAEAESGAPGVDDTEVFWKAIEAIKKVGRGTLWITAQRLNGEPAVWTIGKSAAEALSISVELCSNITVVAYGANFEALTTGTQPLLGTALNKKEFGEYLATNVKWFGGNFIGTGAEKVNQFVISADRIHDWDVRDVTVENWGTANGSGVFNFSDAKRTRVVSNTMLECCKKGGFNAINFQVSTHGSDLLPQTEILIDSNVVTGCGAAPICVQIGAADDYVNTVPTRTTITNNIAESTGFMAIVMEIGGGAGAEAPLGHLNKAFIAFNHARYTGPNEGNHPAIGLTNDSAPVIESGTLYTDIIVAYNMVDSTRHGIQCHASFALLEGNIVNAAVNGIYAEPSSSASSISHVQVRGGVVKMAEGEPSTGVSFKHVTDGFIDTDIAYSATGTAGSASGVLIQSCTRVDNLAKVSFAPKYGCLILTSGSIYVKSGARIYNPSTNATVAAVRVEGVLTGNVWIDDIHVKDDRGGEAKMKYGIDNASTEGGKVFSRRNTMLGWTSAAHNGTFTQKYDNTVDETATLSGSLEWKEVEEVNAKLEANFSTIQCAVANGITYLRGSMKCKVGEEIAANQTLFKLPAGTRPASTRLITEPTTEAVRAGKVEASGAVTSLNALKSTVGIGFDGVSFAQ